VGANKVATWLGVYWGEAWKQVGYYFSRKCPRALRLGSSEIRGRLVNLHGVNFFYLLPLSKHLDRWNR
jgi:hypothetical protein